MTESYLDFEERPRTGKTRRYGVFSKRHGTPLGSIRWHGPWRQYCFFPLGETVWSKGCLEEIGHFIDGLMEERRIDRLRKPCPICGHPMTTSGVSWLCVGCGAIRLRDKD